MKRQRHFTSSAELRRHVVETGGGKVNVAFSMGKDALAAFLALRDEPGIELSLHYTYLVPGLEFVDEWIAYYERKLGIKIHQLPHYSCVRYLAYHVFQPERRYEELLADRWNVYNNAQMHAYARHLCGVPPSTYIATGVRGDDSPLRRTSITAHGTLNPKTRTFFAIYDWGIRDVIDKIKASGLKLPVDYLLFGRSFDGIDFRFLAPLKQHFPKDYERILEWVPLAYLEEARRGLWNPTKEKNEKQLGLTLPGCAP